MTARLLIAAAAATACATAAGSALAMPAPPPPPAPAEMPVPDAAPAPAIFTYRVDGRCRVDATRRLQGPDSLRWQDADQALDITSESTVFRYVSGQRVQLRERRVKLLGEMVREGLLVCHVRPSGEVVKAWIERHDTSPARRQTVQREALTIRSGRIGDLGTYSVSFDT